MSTGYSPALCRARARKSVCRQAGLLHIQDTGVTAAAVADADADGDAGARPSQTQHGKGGDGKVREVAEGKYEREREEARGREWLEVGPVIVSALILDQFTGYTRVCASTNPPTRRSVSSATSSVNTHIHTRAHTSGEQTQFCTLTYSYAHVRTGTYARALTD